MASLKASPLILNSSKQTLVVKASINLPNRVARISLPGRGFIGQDVDLHKLTEKQLSPVKINTNGSDAPDPIVLKKLYAMLEAVADRVEMHKNIGDQRNNWNTLLLTSINSITLGAATMAGISAINGGGAPAEALKLSSTVMYVAATGMLSVVNKIQPSQLAEEQRNATRLFKQLRNQIQSMISIGNPTSVDVKQMMDRVLALDKAYPLPLLGAMLEKFPATVEPAVWWPEQRRKQSPRGNRDYNGWNGKLEEEMREVVKVLKTKDEEDYLRLGEKAVKFNKFLAIAGPVLTGLGAVGTALSSHGGLAAVVGVMGGALASVVNSLEHGGQVGMVFEMYRSNAGFFKMMEESIEWNLREEDMGRRENGEVLEMKVGLQLGRSLSQLRDLGENHRHEFGSKLF